MSKTVDERVVEMRFDNSQLNEELLKVCSLLKLSKTA